MIENESSGLSLHAGRRGRKPISFGAGVAVLLIVIGGAAGCGNAPALTAAAASPTSASSATRTTTVAPTTTAAPTSSVAPSAAVEPVGIAAVPNRRAPVAAAATTTTRRAAPTTTAKPAPKPAPAPAPKPAPKPAAASSGCDSNYSGCVPIASDVDCAGGSGNGPAYVRGPVRVTGSDIYGLDGDHDGTGCDG